MHLLGEPSLSLASYVGLDELFWLVAVDKIGRVHRHPRVIDDVIHLSSTTRSNLGNLSLSSLLNYTQNVFQIQIFELN